MRDDRTANNNGDDFVSAPLITIGEAAKYLGVDRKTIYRLVEWEEIRAIKVGRAVRIEKKSLDDFKETGKSI